MAEHIIDCGTFGSREEFYDALSSALTFPDWFGRNLDAMVDCLTDIHTDTTLRLYHWGKFRNTVGIFAPSCRCALSHAAKKNPNLQIYIEE